MIKQIIETLFSKAREMLVDYAFDTWRDKANFRSTIENLEYNLKSLSAKAYDVEKEIRMVELQGKKKRKREVEEWLEEVKTVESRFLTLENEVQMEGFIKQLFGGDQAIKLNTRVCELVEQSRHFGELLLDDDSTSGEKFLVTKLVGQAFDENLKRIWKFLVIDKVPSIGIHGMGGVGKSNLAKHINNQLLERGECVLYVTISQDCSIKMSQDKIARVLRLVLSDEDDEDKRAARLNRALCQRKNLVLILDEVWENINLEKVGDPLSVEGCRLMITTRSLDVCRQIGCREVIALKPLLADEEWNLFREKLGQETTLTPQVQEIAKSVAKVCGGLPLGIITLAGSMRGETDTHVWRNALIELQKSIMGHDEMDDPVFKVLKYSFDRLDLNHQIQGKRNGYTTLQLCFLYCSLYPEDCKIQRKELVRKFISEELVDIRKSMEAQLDEGYSILNRLVNVSLLESAIAGDDKWLKMHDLVRAMALKITEDRTMVIAGQDSLKRIPDEEEWTTDLEKISLMMNSINEIPLGMSPNCPRLTTLLLNRNPLKLIPESFFSRLPSLCALDLSATNIKELPDSLSDLKSLKALLLGRCRNLEYVPYLGKLKALRELDLSDTAIREVPQGLEELVGLKYLSLHEAKDLQMLPASLLLNFPCLQLLYLPYQIQANLEEIERLKKLDSFEGRLKDMCDFNRFIETRRSEKHSVSYSIMVGEFEGDSFFYDSKNKLVVDNYDLNRREAQGVTILADDTRDLHLQNCSGLSNCLLDGLSNPRSLETLTVLNCKGIECILTYEQFMAPQEQKSRFQALELMCLNALPDFLGVIYEREILGAAVVASPPPQQAAFSSLRSMSIGECNKVKKLGLPMSVFKNLESISIRKCEEIEEIIEVGDDDGRGEEDPLVISFPKLRYFCLEKLPRLRSICKGKMVCTSIQKIILNKCPALKKLPLYFPPSTATPALEEIEISDEEWWGSLEWDHPTHSHLLQPFLKFRGYN